jgi:pseudouridine-5'-phosphate glycosidase
MNSALLVGNPIPSDSAFGHDEMEPLIARASEEARAQGKQGSDVTPFLLQRLNEMTEQRSIRANTALLLSNARLAARIASAIAE